MTTSSGDNQRDVLVLLVMALYAALVTATFLPLGVDAVGRQAFRPIWFYFFGMPLAPWFALIAWKRKLYWVAVVLLLAPNITLGGILPVYLPLSLVLVVVAVKRALSGRRQRPAASAV